MLPLSAAVDRYLEDYRAHAKEAARLALLANEHATAAGRLQNMANGLADLAGATQTDPAALVRGEHVVIITRDRQGQAAITQALRHRDHHYATSESND
jgi:hypothetical protein